MSRCVECAVEIEGTWVKCPLCGAWVEGELTPSPIPAVPLKYSRRRVLRILFLSSIAVIVVSFTVQLFFARGPAAVGAFRSVWLGVITMWLLVIMTVRKRRNVAKNTVYLVVLVGLICGYWDYLTGWHGWSVSYAVPIVSASAIVGLILTVQLLPTRVSEHIVYSGLTILLGLVPIVFVIFGWVNDALPSIICVAVAMIGLIFLRVVRGAEVRHELSKRLHL